MFITFLAAAVLFVISFCKQCLAVKLTPQHKYSRCVLSVPHGGEIRLNKPNTRMNHLTESTPLSRVIANALCCTDESRLCRTEVTQGKWVNLFLAIA